ncbi:hypothetical protein [Bradyrhizobium sp. ORS 86]|uniref:hypothetical protein n=1 Tax=Bradyrhizobium sp. ORS 86 TaxID=1685970 RepID=UPI00388EEFAA
MDLKSAAAEAEQVIENVMKVEPIVMTALSFVPGAAPVTAIVHPAVVMMAPFIENALKAVADGNNGDAFTALIQMIQHITPNQPNSPILSQPSSLSPSAQGSG